MNKDKKYQVRTDIASELLDINRKKRKGEKEYVVSNIKVLKKVIDEDEAKVINKMPGVYYTIDTRSVKTHDNDELNNCVVCLSDVIKDIMKVEKIRKTAKGMIVGLGNINVTPDSLGPVVIDNVIVTRHMFMINPKEVSKGINEVCALAPGVMGTTGIETYDIIKSITEKIKIDYLIVVDALASLSVDRINKTIQITNTGISPGSGVGNKRKEISFKTMGVPVIAIGVPTVVDAISLVSEAIDVIKNHLSKMLKSESVDFSQEIFGSFGLLNENEKYNLIEEILHPTGFNMMVTPKEVDLDIADFSQIISRAIDRAIHPLVGEV